MATLSLLPSRWRRGAAVSRATGWGESTFEELRWQRARDAGRRWAIAGAVIGALVAVIAFAPAAWVADRVARASNGHLLLADARGTLWRGSAVAVLAGGLDSREARSLPGRLHWTLRPSFSQGLGLRLELEHACCLNGKLALQMRPGFNTLTTTLQGGPGRLGQWPAAWLTGLGTPWNTLQLAGTLRLASPGLNLQWVQGRWRVEGEAVIEIQDVASRISTLDRLGSYRLRFGADPANPGSAQLELSSAEGSALQLSGQGSLGPGGLRFRGEASASDTHRTALDNLLNIIGRRDGARSVISIG